MDFNVHVYHHIEISDPVTASQLDRIEQALAIIQTEETEQMANLDGLRAEVEENRSVTDSAVALIGGLAQQIRDLSTDPAALQALADQLDTQNQQLAGAVAANTPAETGAGTDTTGTGGAGVGQPTEGGVDEAGTGGATEPDGTEGAPF